MKPKIATLVLIWLCTGGSAIACSVSASALVFGSINPLVATATDSAADIDVTCPSTTSYSVSLSTGNGTFSSRYMVSGSNSLSYNLYTDASRSVVWGDGSGGSATVSGSADETGTRHTVYGRVPHAPQTVPGSYADTIIVTVTY